MMRTPTREILEQFADACRRGLMTLQGKEGSWYCGFPKGRCGDVSELLGIQLRSRLGVEGTWVGAKNHPNFDSSTRTHAWLEVGDFIIDLSYDQFEGTHLSGWVFDKPGTWHSQFRERSESPVPALASMLAVHGMAPMSRELDRLPNLT